MRRLIENPDKQRIYHVWHYCGVCKKTFTHSQASFDAIKLNASYRCCRDNLKSVSTEIDRIYIYEWQTPKQS